MQNPQNPPLRVSENSNPDGAIDFSIADLFVTGDPTNEGGGLTINTGDNEVGRIHFADPEEVTDPGRIEYPQGNMDMDIRIDATEEPQNDGPQPDPETIQARAINLRYHGVDPAVALPDDIIDEAMRRWEEDRLAHPTPEMPIQPMHWDADGTLRFRENRIVRMLLDGTRPIDLNDIGQMYIRGVFNQAEMEQFAQLIGYSISGWTELNYVSDHTWDRALNTEPPPMRNPRHPEATEAA